MTAECQKYISCQRVHWDRSRNAGSVVFAQLPLVAYYQGSDR